MACCLAAPSLLSAKPLLEQVEGPVVWNAMTAMLRHCDNKATKRDSVLQIIKFQWECGGLSLGIRWTNIRATGDGNIMTLMLRHCNNNAISILQMITSPGIECGGLVGCLNKLKGR